MVHNITFHNVCRKIKIGRVILQTTKIACNAIVKLLVGYIIFDLI